MLTVTQEFKDALREPVKATSGYIVLQNGSELRPDGDLQSYTIETVGGFLRTAMSKIKIDLLGDHQLQGQTVDAFYGVQYDGEYHYVLKGKYTIESANYKKDKGTTELIGYDGMIGFEMAYVTVGLYPTTLYQYLQAVCALAGVVLENEEVYNGDLEIEEDFYKNANEYTARDVLEDICEAAASYAIINPSGNLELRQVEDTGVVLDYSDMLEYNLGDYWGGVNSLVLSRQPQNDDVFIRDDLDINSPTTKNVLDLSKFSVGYLTGES